MMNLLRHTEAYEATEFRVFTPETVSFNQNLGQVIIDDEFVVSLERRSPVIGQLQLGVDPELLKPQFLEGQYFAVDGQIVDFREKQHLKFMHDAKSIEKLAATIGFLITDKGRIVAGNRTASMTYDAFATEGGVFDVDIGFSWSPFSIDIDSALNMIRQICENGMVARAPMLNHRIPMLNAWEENLAISNDLIKHSFERQVGPRLKALRDERISMHDVGALRSMVNDLAASKEIAATQRNHLNTIIEVLDPLFTADVERIKPNMLKFIAAPVSAYDAFNIATECSTHYVGEDRTGTRLTGFANHLIFDPIRQNNLSTQLDTLVADTMTLNNPDQAFFGITAH